MSPRDYAVLAQATYTTSPNIGNPDSAARAVFFSGDVIGFPGSNNVACWLADMDVLAVDVPDMGRLHAGFWSAFNEIATPLLARRGVTVTLGHSEGAALALLYAAQLCLAGRPPLAVYAFEPPRISADSTLAVLFRQHGVQLHLYRNGEDVVPLVPRLLENWQHPGTLIGIGTAALPFPNVEDHLIDRVIAALAGG